MIKFSKKEKEILSLLMDVVKTQTPNTVLRIAGGYIRDKLLSIDSDDIDIAVNNMSGEQFAHLVNKHMGATGKLTVVKANPDQSKHLATAMLRIKGLPIDFVNLRKEEYADSRIPIVSPGTPEEDASRRDLTINSLFYNINTGEIEDFVGGLYDLEHKIARTPTHPVQTFLDDPLRILRTIRFATKYGLLLDPKLVLAANMPEVQEAFRNKISAERIWAELGFKLDHEHFKPGALAGNNPGRAIDLIKKLGIRDIIFDLSDEEMKALGLKDQMVSWDADQKNPHHDLDIWSHTVMVVNNLVSCTSDEVRSDVKTFLVRNLAALFHDIGKRYVGAQQEQDGSLTYHGHEEVSVEIARKILNKMRAPKEIIVRVTAMIGAHMKPHLFDEKTTPKGYRRFVQNLGEDWENTIDLAIADAYGKLKATGDISLERKYEELRGKIRDAQSPVGQPTGKLISRFKGIGHDLMNLGLKGKQIGIATDMIEEALLDTPELTKEEVLSMIGSRIQDIMKLA